MYAQSFGLSYEDIQCTWKLFKSFSRYDMHKYVFNSKDQKFGISCHRMLLIQFQLIVLRIAWIFFAVIKKCTIIFDLILLELEREV